MWRAGLADGHLAPWLPLQPDCALPVSPLAGVHPLPGLSGAQLPPGPQLLSLTFSISVSGQIPRAKSQTEVLALWADKHW